MSNSSLVDYKKISPHKNSPRKNKIDTITIHCYVGQVTVENAGKWFASEKAQCSCNYVIGTDGRIGLIVDEGDRSWCSSNPDNDNRAVTIECASDAKHPYAINDKVYDSLIKLCTDICKRNDIKELKWKADKSLIGRPDEQNLTVHRWFAAKACPGDYIYKRLGQIAREVNVKLNENKKQPADILYRVQVGAFSVKSNAVNMQVKLKNAGYTNTTIIKHKNVYRVQVGAFSKKANAKSLAKKLEDKDFSTYITTSSGTDVKATVKKSITTIAKEVIAGKWGNGDSRKKALEKAGYDYDAVQKKVNELMK